MSAPPTVVASLSSYRNELPYPFCPGCGHHAILDHLNAGLVELQLDPRQVVLVSDIGCSGLSDQYFATSAFHGLHGRSITYATGIKLARPDLKVIVIMGDGGTGIGGAHLLAAARRNIGLTVLVFNNFTFGMTGGQHSGTTPPGAHTSTTPDGNLERPLDICATVAANGAGFVWRGTSFDADLPLQIAAAVRSESFALLDVWELCTAYYVPANHASKRTLGETLDRLGLRTGVLQRREHPEYAAAYRAAAAAHRGESLPTPRPVAPAFVSRLSADQISRPGRDAKRAVSLVIAGSAGGKVRSTARLVAEAALLSGLHVTQRDDYPITVRTGHSLAELLFSPDAIDYTGITPPDALVILSRDGLAKAGKLLETMAAEGVVFALPDLGELKTAARVVPIDPTAAAARLGTRRLDPGRLALHAVTHALRTLDLFPIDALRAAASGRSSPLVQELLATIDAS